MAQRLKLYVWEDVLVNDRPAMAFALARNADEAREAIRKKEGQRHIVSCLDREPKVVEAAEGFTCSV